MDTTFDDPGAIRRAMQAAQRRRTWRALLLVGPLALFLLAIFVIPIASLLTRAADNPEVTDTLPRTLQVLAGWDGRSEVPDAAFQALVQDLTDAKNTPDSGELARRLNYEISGYRSLIFKTLRRMPLEVAGDADARAQLIKLDKRWADPAYWEVIASNDRTWTPYYLLASLDLKLDANGSIVAVPPNTSAFQAIFSRTFVISLVVTLITLALGYPLAYWITRLPKRRANLVLICILIPFWTSVLVRIAAWVVLLQREGLINSTLGDLGLIAEPLPLLFNRLGVYIAMVHILLPFMVLPLYSVMQSVPPSYQRAAISLGSHPFAAFWRVYVPQTYPGIAAGSLLVFIIAIGYYITPALLGGAGDQMISYYVAYFTNQTINWGMASALGLILLAATLLLYALYRRISGKELALN
ncbi:ABC transporter permease [Castellaniella ginsengisoli]|uniref:ABC transporter permease n=1 Tax=Castellaniella ginsengisoli TaxID=546114 RepID=A0AB39CXQ4_9BURK